MLCKLAVLSIVPETGSLGVMAVRMARKKKEGELKDVRIPIMMTETEVKAIDDWGFEHRIRSRSEVIRRLCQFALLVGEHMQHIDTMQAAISKALKFAYSKIEDQESKDKLVELTKAIAPGETNLWQIMLAYMLLEQNPHIDQFLTVIKSIPELHKGLELQINFASDPKGYDVSLFDLFGVGKKNEPLKMKGSPHLKPLAAQR